jgi:sarcosine oxidase subunit beta
MRSADVVIIGAGVIGASVAYRLRERGLRFRARARASPRAGTGQHEQSHRRLSRQFGSEVNVRLSLLSREKLLRFEEGLDSGYRAGPASTRCRRTGTR